MLVISMLAMWAVTASFLDEYNKCAFKQGLKKCTTDDDCGCPTQECVGIFEGYKSCVGCPDSVIDEEKICAGLKTGCKWDSVHKKCSFKINGAPTECVDMRSKSTCSNKEGCVWKKRKCHKYVCPDVNPQKCESIKGCTWNLDEKKCVLGESKGVVRKDSKMTKMCRKKRKSKAKCERAGCVYTQVLSKRVQQGQKPKMIESCIPKPEGWTAAPTQVTMIPTPAPSQPPTLEPTPAPTESPSLKPTVAVTPVPTHLPTVAVTPQPTELPTTLEPTTPAPTETPQPTAADIAVSFDEVMCKSKVSLDNCKVAGCVPIMNKDNQLSRCKAHDLKCSNGMRSKLACESLGDDKFICQWMPNATREKKRCVPKK